MLLSDNIHPKNCIYYGGAMVLKILQQDGNMNIGELYVKVKEHDSMSFPMLVLCLDWLYLINVAKINEKGVVELCS